VHEPLCYRRQHILVNQQGVMNGPLAVRKRAVFAPSKGIQ
jgi:hypothetical protein